MDGNGEIFGIGGKPVLTDADFVRIFIEQGRLGVSARGYCGTAGLEAGTSLFLAFLTHTLIRSTAKVAFDFGGGARSELFDAVVNDDEWHIVAVSWNEGVVSVRLDGFALGFAAGQCPSLFGFEAQYPG